MTEPSVDKAQKISDVYAKTTSQNMWEELINSSNNRCNTYIK